MPEAGVSAGYVQAAIAPLEAELHRCQSAIAEMEREMGQVANAVDRMGNKLGNGLDSLKSGQEELASIQMTTQEITREQFVAANSQLGVLNVSSITGFAKVDGGLKVVSQDQRAMTQAMVQMEVIRLLNEARAPVRKVIGFSEEIEQRFCKALESVYLVRAQYDHLLGTAMEQYGSKLRLIGEHIYAIYEECFRESAELPLSTPPEFHQAFAEAVDSQRVQERSNALDANLREVGKTLLQPLLDRQESFERLLAETYAVPVPVQERVAVPAAVCYRDDDARPDVRVAPALARFGEAVRARAPELMDQLVLQALDAAALTKLKGVLTALANAGKVEEPLLHGYFDYLDAFGLSVIADGQVVLTGDPSVPAAVGRVARSRKECQ